MKSLLLQQQNRIMFLMNAKEDIGGKINDILKEGQHYIEAFENVTTLSVNKYLDQNSLYLPRTIKKVKNVDLIIDEPLDENARLEAIEKLKRNEKYTKTAIEKVVLEELSEKVYETKVKNEVEDDQEDIGAYYLYVVCANDTYENIAKAYNMDEKVIRDYNNNLSLDVGQILIIPYDSKTDTNKV